MRLVFVVGGARRHPWLLPASMLSDRTWIHGGERTMYECAAAAAALGHDVELRGDVSARDLEEITRWSGVQPRTGLDARRPSADDVVFVPESGIDPPLYARLALSPARAVMVILAAPGLFGPAVIPGFARRDPLHVHPSEVGLPEQYRAIRSIGFELWTNSPAIATEASAAGVECTFIGTGQPVPFPEPGERPYLAAFLAENRWASLARTVAERISGPVLEIAKGPRDEILRGFALAQIAILPAVIEGQGRTQIEARAVGTIPVALRSNRYAAGLEDGGGVVVDSVEGMAAEIERLAASPSILRERSSLAMSTAREQMDWSSYVVRVQRALERPAAVDLAHPLRAQLGEALQQSFAELYGERATLRNEVEKLHRGVSWLEGLREAAEGDRVAVLQEAAWLRGLVARLERERDEARGALDAVRRRPSVRLALRLARVLKKRDRSEGGSFGSSSESR